MPWKPVGPCFDHANARGTAQGTVEVKWENGRPTVYESAIEEMVLSDGTVISRAEKGQPVVIRDDRAGTATSYTHSPETGWSARKTKRKLTWHAAGITPGPDTVTRIGALEADRFGNLRIGNLWFDAKGPINYRSEAFSIIRRANRDDNVYIRLPNGEVMVLTYGRSSSSWRNFWWVRTYAEVIEEEVRDEPFIGSSVIVTLLRVAAFAAVFLFLLIKAPAETVIIIIGAVCIGGAVKLVRRLDGVPVRTPDIPNFHAE